MTRIAVASYKGGTGKTTTAVGLAAAAGADGRRVLLVDADVDQAAGTAIRWQQTLFAAAAPGVDPLDLYRSGEAGRAAAWAGVGKVGFECLTIEMMEQLRIGSLDGWDDVIVDCPPGRPDRITLAVRMADVAILPCGPHPAEVEAIGAVMRLIEETGRPVSVRVALTRVQGSWGATEKAISALDAGGYVRFTYRTPMRAEIAGLYPSRHPSRSAAGWVSWRGMWAELTLSDKEIGGIRAAAEHG